MEPSFDGSDDANWIGCPGEGFGVFVGFGDTSIEGGLEIDEGKDDAPLEPSAKCGLTSIPGGPSPPLRNRLERPKYFDDGHNRFEGVRAFYEQEISLPLCAGMEASEVRHVTEALDATLSW